jgi:acyl-CoA dehydrogenase
VDILTYQLSAPLDRGPHADLGAFFARLARCPYVHHVERALWAGLHADRLAHAFVGGYGAALATLLAAAGHAVPGRFSLCATEAGGAHPRNVQTRLVEGDDRLVLSGEKTFATLAAEADELLVVATTGTGGDGRSRLRVVRVRPDAKGVAITARPPLPFAPELPHAVVTLRDVVVRGGDVLPGDGYDDYLKPFRTLEDTYVLAATTGYLIGVARAHGWDPGIVTELASLATAVCDVAARSPREPLTHLLLAGAFAALRRLLPAVTAEWAKTPDDEHARWERDQGLLVVAESARRQRTTVAWQALRNAEGPLPS